MGRQHPRISVLKLAEYMGANPVRRRAIIRDQHKPPEAVVPYYRRAMSAAVRFFRRGANNYSILEKAIADIGQTEPSSDWHVTDLNISVEALKHLIQVLDQIELGDRILKGRRGAGVLRLAGVEVSVRPHIRLVTQGAGGLRVGAVKLAFSKSRLIPEEEGLRAATLLRYHLDDKLTKEAAEADPNLCQIVDLFREEVYAAPSAFKRTMYAAEAACEEISAMWPTPPGPKPSPRVPTTPIYPTPA